MRLSKLLLLLVVLQIHLIRGMPSGQSPKIFNDTIKIGLLIQNNESLAAKHGVELAIRSANEKKGLYGRKFQVVVRSMEGPWGTGSKEAESMVFDKRVFAIIGSHDGRNAHLVEQVVAKTHISYISARATDPTLSQAFVPWFFSCVPNDIQQAALLTEEIYHTKDLKKAIIVSDNSYDANQAVKSLLKKIKEEGISEPERYTTNNSEKDIRNIVDQLKKAGNIDCIIFFGHPDFVREFIGLISFQKINLPIYCSLFSVTDKELSYAKFLQSEKIVRVSSGFYLRASGIAFIEEFKKVYGNEPTEDAAYAFDSANLIIKAILSAGYDREKVKCELAKIHYEGVTGSIEFDDKGNRIGEAGLVEMRNGKPVVPGG